MVGTLDLTDYYSASNFEEDVICLLETLHRTTPTVVMTGGSMMYIDAVCKGIDDIPTVTPDIREAIYAQFEREGLENILQELKESDPSRVSPTLMILNGRSFFILVRKDE